MKILFNALFSFLLLTDMGSALATGYGHRTYCVPDDAVTGPELTMSYFSHAAPGGPIYQTSLIEIEGVGQYYGDGFGHFRGLIYSGLRLSSHAISNSYSMLISVTLEEGREEILQDSLYHCQDSTGNPS